MSDFLSRSKDLFAAQPKSFPAFERIFALVRQWSEIKTYYDADLLNIEEILSILEMGDFADKALGAPDYKT